MNEYYWERAFSVVAKSAPVKSSVQKINLVAALVRGDKVSNALLQLKFCKRKVADDLGRVLQSAVSNAENNFGMDVDKLYIDKILVGKAFTLKRFKARAKGRAGRIQKPFSRVSIFVYERD